MWWHIFSWLHRSAIGWGIQDRYAPELPAGRLAKVISLSFQDKMYLVILDCKGAN